MKLYRIISIIIAIIFTQPTAFGRDESKINPLSKAATQEFVLFEGNNIRNWIGNQGHLTSHIPTGNSGCEWPAGSGNTAIFVSGIWVMGLVDGDLRSADAEYTSEWTPGTIPYNTQTKLPLSDTPINTPLDQIYYIQQDNSVDQTSSNYNPEYATWPASQGAPAHDGELFSDLNGNGIWDSGEHYQDYDRDGTYDGPDGSFITGEDPPRFMGDHMAWWVMNDWDAAAHNYLWGSAPLGLEAQVLVYTRNPNPILEDVIFYQITLVNKGGQFIDSTYFALWSDMDIGDASDDEGACDSTLSLTYLYNANAFDYKYGVQPPAVGYKILQGPMVPAMGDTVYEDGHVYPDYETLGMTASHLNMKSDPYLGDPRSLEESYFYLRGLGRSGEPFLDPWGATTPFLFSGDPVNRTGWLASDTYNPGDRRFLMSSGPFDLSPWDDTNDNGMAEFGEPGVQVIHSALIISSGVNNLDAITNLKYVSQFTQYQYDHGTEVLQMDRPELSASSHDQEIILNWHTGAEEYEVILNKLYNFEGYNLYQGATANGPWTKLMTYDVENGVGIIMDQSFDENGILLNLPIQLGEDQGLEHLLSVQSDILNDDVPLVNNKLYHFAIDAYSYAEAAFPKTISSDKQILSIRPHVNYDSAAPRDTLLVDRPEFGEVAITVDVRDPATLTGQDYEVGFEYDSTGAKGRWQLLRSAPSSQDTLLRSEWFNGWYEPTTPIYVDGFELSLANISFEKPKVNSTWVQTVNLVGTQFETLILAAVSPGGVDSLAWTDETRTQVVKIDTLAGPDYYYDYWEYDDLVGYFYLYKEVRHDVRIQGFASTYGAVNGDRIADIPNVGGGTENVEFLQGNLEVRFTEQGQLATRYLRQAQDTLIQVPFEVWDVERNIQLCLGIKDNNKTGGIQDPTLDDWEHTLDYDWVVVFYEDYATHSQVIQPMRDNPVSGWSWQFNNKSIFSIGDVVLLTFLNPVAPGDTYSWTTGTGPSTYDQTALDKIQVFPNPFYGYHADQSSFYEPYVTFSNLPNAECTIRIYSLGGQLAHRIDHTSGSYETWDLLNTQGAMVASGMYIAHVEVPELGEKILKLALLQPDR